MKEKRLLSDYTLEELKKSYDPYYMYSDDFSVYEKHRLIAAEIRARKELKK